MRFSHARADCFNVQSWRTTRPESCKLQVAEDHARVLTEAGAPLVGAGLEAPYVLISPAIPGEALPVNRSRSRGCSEVREFLDEG